METTTTTIELGNFESVEQCLRTERKLQGKSFYNLQCHWGTHAGNYPFSVSTDRPDTTELELYGMVAYLLATTF